MSYSKIIEVFGRFPVFGSRSYFWNLIFRILRCLAVRVISILYLESSNCNFLSFSRCINFFLKSNQAIETKSIIPSTSKNTTPNTTPMPSSSPEAAENQENENSDEIAKNTESSLIIGSNNDVNDGDSDIFGKF